MIKREASQLLVLIDSGFRQHPYKGLIHLPRGITCELWSMQTRKPLGWLPRTRNTLDRNLHFAVRTDILLQLVSSGNLCKTCGSGMRVVTRPEHKQDKVFWACIRGHDTLREGAMFGLIPRTLQMILSREFRVWFKQK